jgi:hypothetical protein
MSILSIFRPARYTRIHPFDKDSLNDREFSPVFSGLITYPVLGGCELSTHQLDLLCSHDRVLIVGTDRTAQFYPRKSLTNSIEFFATVVLMRFPWIDNVHWDFIERDFSGRWSGVTFTEEVDKRTGLRLINPVWEPLDGKRIELFLSQSETRPELAAV